MIRTFLLAAMLIGVTASATAQKTRYSTSSRPDALDYPVAIHVVRSHLETVPVAAEPGATAPAAAETFLYLNAVVDGRSMILRARATALLHPGEYRARIATEGETKSGFFSRSYELLFGDNTRVVFQMVGEGE